MFQKIVHTNLPQAGFELGSLGPQAGVLPIEPPLLVLILFVMIVYLWIPWFPGQGIFFQMLALLRRAYFWPPSMVYISVINTQTLQITFLHDIDLLWAAFHVLHQHLSISTICQSAEYILELNIHIQIWTIQLLIFTEKFSPLVGFEPRTSPLPSRYATNWAILAWITWYNLHF